MWRINPTCRWAASLLISTLGVSTPKSQMPSAPALVRAYNARRTGAPGWRRVLISLSEAGKVTQTFQVVNVWRDAPNRAAMLFYLESPFGLQGTRYLQLERPSDADSLTVYLYLPTSTRVLRLAQGLYGEGLLGSDFAYDQMRTELPLNGYSYSVAGIAEISGKPTWRLESIAQRPDSVWRRATFYITQDTPFVMGADYFETAGGPPAKQMRVERFRDVKGVRSAERMLMQSCTGTQTTIALQDARFALPDVGAHWFASDSLIPVGDMLRAGWPLRK